MTAAEGEGTGASLYLTRLQYFSVVLAKFIEVCWQGSAPILPGKGDLGQGKGEINLTTQHG